MHSDEPLPPEQVQFGRILDPVRAHAVHEAVKLCRRDPAVKVSMVIEIAKLFEEYLAGADDA